MHTKNVQKKRGGSTKSKKIIIVQAGKSNVNGSHVCILNLITRTLD